jgi:hypothetical protein
MLATMLLALAPAAMAGGPNSPVLVTTGAVIQSESSGEPIQVDPGAWLLFRTGNAVTDEFIDNLDSITIEILLDGESLEVETVIEDLGETCGVGGDPEACADAEVLWGYASSHPLSPGSVHTLTYRHTASEAGQDGFGNSWDAGVFFESTATLVAGGD